MTVTETRPGAAGAVDAPASGAEAGGEQGAPAAAPAAVATADHKGLGLVFLFAATLFLILGLVMGELLQSQLAAPGTNVVGSRYGELLSLHATATAVLFLGPLWLGLATYLLPLQIGASRLALPRLHAFATWLYVVGGVVFLVSYLPGVPSHGGITLSEPVAAAKGLGRGDVAATSLWVVGLFLVGLASVLASGDLIVTMLRLRAEGVTLARVPLFSWASFATSAVVVLATPVFLGGLTLLYLDQRYGGTFFSPSDKAADCREEYRRQKKGTGARRVFDDTVKPRSDGVNRALDTGVCPQKRRRRRNEIGSSTSRVPPTRNLPQAPATAADA